LLVIAGSGRSGTSLMAGLAGRLGYRIPQPELNSNESNPHGFGEPRWAVGFHKELLRSANISHEDARPEAWDVSAKVAGRDRARARLGGWLEEQFEQSDRVVVKDPRLAWFLELYGAVADELSAELAIVTMLRDPAETVRSRQMAYTSAIDATTRMAGWLNMMLSLECLTRGRPRAIIRYEDLLVRWQPTLRAAEPRLRLSLVSDATPDQLAAAGSLVDPSLRRASASLAELDLFPVVQTLAERAYQALGDLALDPDAVDPGAYDVSSSFEPIDGVRRDYERFYLECEAVTRSSITAARSQARRRAQREQRGAAAPTADAGPGVKSRLARVLRRDHA
jgi:hypothetical protein